MPTRVAPLAGRRVLVVEDEFVIADEIAHALSEAGAKVVGPAPTLSQALAMAESQRIDAAVLDINLGGMLSWPLIDVLLARSVEVMLVSGYDSASVPARYAHLCRWAKPVQIRQLVRSLAREFASASNPAAAWRSQHRSGGIDEHQAAGQGPPLSRK